jgi:hypothetical protein
MGNFGNRLAAPLRMQQHMQQFAEATPDWDNSPSFY